MLQTKKLKPSERRDRSDEFANWSPRPRAPVQGSGVVMALCKEPAKPVPKTPERKSQAIRDSAKGEECTVRIPGVCRGGTEHTIWSHAPLGAAGKGLGLKALDLAGAYCCTACDACVDQAAGRGFDVSREMVLNDWFMGHMRSLVILKQKGLV